VITNLPNDLKLHTTGVIIIRRRINNALRPRNQRKGKQTKQDQKSHINSIGLELIKITASS
jgi:hypothetical protein